MTTFADTTAYDLRRKLTATVDMGLVDAFNEAFNAYWETEDMEGVASEAAATPKTIAHLLVG